MSMSMSMSQKASQRSIRCPLSEIRACASVVRRKVPKTLHRRAGGPSPVRVTVFYLGSSGSRAPPLMLLLSIGAGAVGFLATYPIVQSPESAVGSVRFAAVSMDMSEYEKYMQKRGAAEMAGVEEEYRKVGMLRPHARAVDAASRNITAYSACARFLLSLAVQGHRPGV